MDDIKSNHPYRSQPDKAFWKKTIQDTYPLNISDWYSKKFNISNLNIATAGSCFAQHIGRELRKQNFNYVDVEPAPDFLKEEYWLAYGYGMYSARYGNVYTSRQLLQLAQRALGEFIPDASSWIKGDGFVDPFRPTIEPEPLRSIDEVIEHRKHHLKAVANLFEEIDVFIFTLGLTETWVSVADGTAFPIVPGTSGGGEYDPVKYKLVNLSYVQVIKDMESFFSRMHQINSEMKFILTVSPVPLMATATQQQVLVATIYSKSVLRAVAGYLSEKLPFVDYFPSFEIISSHVMRGQFYNPDMRTVSHYGVEHVMNQFFTAHLPAESSNRKIKIQQQQEEDDVVCDEELLAVFGDRRSL